MVGFKVSTLYIGIEIENEFSEFSENEQDSVTRIDMIRESCHPVVSVWFLVTTIFPLGFLTYVHVNGFVILQTTEFPATATIE